MNYLARLAARIGVAMIALWAALTLALIMIGTFMVGWHMARDFISGWV